MHAHMHECACLRERGAQTHTSPHTQKQALRLHFQADVPPFDTEEARRVIMETYTVVAFNLQHAKTAPPK